MLTSSMIEDATEHFECIFRMCGPSTKVLLLEDPTGELPEHVRLVLDDDCLALHKGRQKRFNKKGDEIKKTLKENPAARFVWLTVGGNDAIFTRSKGVPLAVPKTPPDHERSWSGGRNSGDCLGDQAAVRPTSDESADRRPRGFVTIFSTCVTWLSEKKWRSQRHSTNLNRSFHPLS